MSERNQAGPKAAASAKKLSASALQDLLLGHIGSISDRLSLLEISGPRAGTVGGGAPLGIRNVPSVLERRCCGKLRA